MIISYLWFLKDNVSALRISSEPAKEGILQERSLVIRYSIFIAENISKTSQIQSYTINSICWVNIINNICKLGFSKLDALIFHLKNKFRLIKWNLSSNPYIWARWRSMNISRSFMKNAIKVTQARNSWLNKVNIAKFIVTPMLANSQKRMN